ncbi:hypothetical protein [Thioclava sp.]|uniref:hypothetical protein n=1 Tax=Thioclava sp. TaxID=1933450 RepID=UPI003AA9466C
MEKESNEIQIKQDLPPKRTPVGWFEGRISARGLSLGLDDVKALYQELSIINRKFGENIISGLPTDPKMSGEEWGRYKDFLLEDAFCLTISILGDQDQQLYGENAEVFESDNLPHPIQKIYFNNITAWQRHSQDSRPQNTIEVDLDFSKPPLLDPFSVLSEPTPNSSNVTVRADDMTFYKAALQIVDTKLAKHRTWYAAIHRSFAYDMGVWLVALPAGLVIATHYMERWLPVGGNLEAFRWAFFLYSLGIVILGYRFLSGYIKWAFPVNVLAENKDKSLRHRIALGGIFVWLAYKAADTIYALLPFAP